MNDTANGERGRRYSTLAGGWVLLGLGGLLLVLPGPGLPLILVGLTLLGREAAWARRAKGWISMRVLRRARRSPGDPPSLAV